MDFAPKPPKCKVGDTLQDEMAGSVKVAAIVKGWPHYHEAPRRGPKQERLVPVLCGDLVRAVCDEPIKKVASHWNVSTYLVKQWQRAIAGTDTGVDVAIALKKATPGFYKKFWRS